MLLSEVEEPDSSFFSRITLKVFASIEKYKEKKNRIKLNQLSLASVLNKKPVKKVDYFSYSLSVSLMNNMM